MTTTDRDPEESNIDHEYLLKLAREKSRDGRNKLTQTILDLFNQQGEVLTDRERALMFGILRSVVREVEMTIRRKISDELSRRMDAPQDLIRLLANDEIDVAYPVLTDSGLLKDEDLIEVIRHRTMEHQLAVAIRQTVSEEVCQALVETGNERVVNTLLQNENARISQNTMEFLVEQSKRVDSFQEPILRREELRPDLAEKMMAWVSAALRQFIVENFKVDPGVVDDVIEAAAEPYQMPDQSKTEGRRSHLAKSMVDEGMITPETLISALRQGEVSLFLAMFCQLTGLREYLGNRILFEPGGEGLAICCKAIGLTHDEFAQIFKLSQASRARRSERIDEALEQALWVFDDTTRETALSVLKTWRRNKGYLNALRQIQVSSAAHDRS